MIDSVTPSDAPDRRGQLETADIHPRRGGALLLLVCAGLGLLAALELTVEKVRILADDSYVPSCDVNPVISCGSVIVTPQASAFGFPNPILGLVGFTVVATLAVLLLAGVALPRWVWLGLNAGAVAGFAFTQWLIVQSLYSIGALCPWCMVVWAVTTPIVVWVTAENLESGRFGVSGPVPSVVAGSRWFVLVAWYLLVAGLIFIRWQDYWVSWIDFSHL